MSAATSTLSPAGLLDALSRVPIFEGVTPEQLQWFIDHSTEERFEEGALLVREGDEADTMTIILEGQLRFQSSEPGSPVMFARPGQVTGVLPYSRTKRYMGNAYAIQPMRIVRISREHFPEMLRQIPQLAGRLVAVMSDRIRENTRLTEHREKLIALGKLAAGLAHELNNPASAAQRSANDLRYWVQLLRDSNQALAEAGFNVWQFQCLLEFEREMIEQAEHAPKLQTIDRSDREELTAAWLREHNVSRAWEFAPFFVEFGIETSRLSEISECYAINAWDAAFSRLAAALALERLTKGIQASTQQMSDLVRAVKDYSFVDQAPQQDIEIEPGIESTLTMLSHLLRPGVSVIREYESSLPRVPAHGSELNQVWTNLIENAVEAMDGHGTLRIRTASEPGMALVEITDSGRGIPPEIRDRIFDPFFTTKDVGAGRGLGLDVVFRIIQTHRGDVTFTSRPGETCFQVRLPTLGLDSF